MKALAIVLSLVPALAFADDDPCTDATVDPIVTPVRDVGLDAQRSACLRSELAAGVLAHALIDTPGFHGDLGGELALDARFALGDAFELSAQLRAVDFAFVQNAVNKTTHTGFGPLVVGAATGGRIGAGARAALVAQLELPYTRDEMDTLHVGGRLAGVVTGRLAPALVLHGRLGALAMHASSLAGSTRRGALVAGSDVVWQARAALAVQAGAELSAGWRPGLDHVLLRAGIHWRLTGDWRLRAGVGAPVGGSERTNAILDVAIVHGI